MTTHSHTQGHKINTVHKHIHRLIKKLFCLPGAVCLSLLVSSDVWTDFASRLLSFDAAGSWSGWSLDSDAELPMSSPAPSMTKVNFTFFLSFSDLKKIPGHHVWLLVWFLQNSVADCHCKLSHSFPTTCFCIYVHVLLACDFSYIPKWTDYLQAIWSFMPSLSPMASLPSGPSWPISAQHPYPPVSHVILQPNNSTLQPPMPSTTPASLTSSPSCLSSAIHPSCLVSHALPQPSIPTLQSLTAYSNFAFPEFCFPNLQSLLPSLSPACAV